MKWFYVLILALCSHSLLAKTEIHLVKDDSVNASSTHITESPVVPNGKIVKLKKLGCIDPAIGDGLDSIIVLQWGTGGSWTTIRACSRNSEFIINRDFIGDGINKFRVLRMNESITPKVIVFWLEALIKD